MPVNPFTGLETSPEIAKIMQEDYLASQKPKTETGMIDTSSAISQVNKQNNYLNQTYPNKQGLTMEQANDPKYWKNGKYVGVDQSNITSNAGNLTTDAGANVNKPTGKAYFTNQAGQEAEYTQEQLKDPNIQNFLKTGEYVLAKSDGVNVNADFTTSETKTEVDQASKDVEDLSKQFLNYNVDQDPDFQDVANDIKIKYAKLKTAMEKTNTQRQRSFETLGLVTGMTQYAGGIQMGIEGEELNQANQRLSELVSEESQAISAARTAFKTGKYTEFNAKVNVLKDIREQKQTELSNYNKAITNYTKKIQEKSEAYQKQVIQASRDTAVSDLLNQGVTDVSEMLNLLNYDESGNQVGDFTAEEVSKSMNLMYNKDALAGLDADYRTFQYLKNSQPQELINMGVSSYQDYLKAVKQAQITPETDLEKKYKLAQIEKMQADTQKVQKELITDTGEEMDDKQRAIFNSIVNKYSSSPLIAAEDRTIVLKNIVKQIKEKPNDGALQLGLVYSYVQALDTYQSAVREGELGLVQSIDSKFGQLKNNIEKIQNGQIVRADVAKNIANAAEALVNTISEGAKQKQKMYRSQAKVNKIESSWDEFVSGFKETGEEKTIDEYRQEFPQASDEELQQLMDEESGKTKPLSKGKNGSVAKIASAIGQFESGGNYKAIGPVTKSGDKAYGKYQIMGNNIPSWSKEAIGKSITKEEFLAKPELQDKIAQYKMEKYYEQYGNIEDVASLWFSGRPMAKAGNAKDVLGTSVPQYIKNVVSLYNTA